jgi:hypothetical protein
MPYTGPTARPLGVAALVIAVLDEPPPDVGWTPSNTEHQADPSGFLKLPTWRMPRIWKVPWMMLMPCPDTWRAVVVPTITLARTSTRERLGTARTGSA